MSHAVVRGKPTAAQLYLDRILDEILLEQGITDAAKRATVSVTEIVFHCLKKKPNATFMTNGANGISVTNEEVLKRAVSLARALIAARAKGKYVMLLMRNHEHMHVVYFAVLFAGIIPYLMDPNTTSYELTHFLNLVEPSYVFHDREYDEVLRDSLGKTDVKPTLFVVDEPEHLKAFSQEFSDDVNSFKVPKALPEDTVMLLPTSGSTGMPKAAAQNNRGMVAHIPTIWAYHTKFPTPTDRVMLLTSIQWVTFTMLTVTCSVYHIPLLISPKVNTVESVTEMLEKYRPTWTFFGPAFASALLPTIRPDQLSSLKTLILLGAPSTPELMRGLQAKLPKTAQLCDGYGCTEAQGFVALPDKEAPFKSNGWVANCIYYKLVDEDGKEVGLKQKGELWIKGPSIILNYHKNDKSYDESFTDGWYRTGDQFYIDENERLSFVVRIKFTFKHNGCHVAPEEVERVIFTVPGVHESIVCATDNGPAAAVVKQPGADVTHEQIHKAVNESLSDHKHLHGGLVFVSSLPHTHSGKIDRKECSKIIEEAFRNGQLK